MTYLLLQTFLLLLSAYFAGAFCACLMKRAMMTRSLQTAAVTARTSPATQVEYPAEIVPLTKPREIDPVQPRIEVFPRPARKVMPTEVQVDISRFDRALTGPDPNEGMPRKMIAEIRPAILKSPTGPAVPFKKPEPKVEAPKADSTKTVASQPATPAPAKPESPKIDVKDVKQDAPAPVQTPPGKSAAESAAAQAAANIQSGTTSKSAATIPAAPPAEAKPKTDAPGKDTATAPSTGASPMMAGIAGASAAAAAAVAAARAAAATIVPRTQPAQPSTPTPPTSEQPKPVADKPGSEKPNPDKFALDKPAVEPRAAEVPAPTPAPAASLAQPAAAQPQPAVSKPTVVEPSTKTTSPQPAAPQPISPQPVSTQPVSAQPVTGVDDLLRIRAIDAETAQRLNGLGIDRFEQIAHWTPADVNRVNQALGLAGRVDREQWIEQAQILAKGGETYYSRNRGAIVKPALEPSTPPAAEKPATAQPEPSAPSKSAAPAPAPAQQPAAEKPAAPAQSTPTQAAPAAPAPSAPAPSAAPAQASSPAPSMTTALQGKSVAEMATAAAAAIAAASASVTRGIRPIEPISPLARANPNIVMPAKLSDALKDNESKAPTAPAATAPAPVKSSGKADDLKRIRGVGVLIEKRLNALGITTYAQVANWTAGDIDRISQTLEFKGRIERESWVEQARILSSGGDTEFSRRVDRGDVETSRDET